MHHLVCWHYKHANGNYTNINLNLTQFKSKLSQIKTSTQVLLLQGIFIKVLQIVREDQMLKQVKKKENVYKCIIWVL